MKKILFIGAGLFQVDGILKAREMNLFTIAIDGNPESIGKKFAHEFECIDITNEVLVFDFAIKNNIDGAVSIASDVSMPSLGYLVTKLKIIGYDYSTIKIVNNKDELFEKLNKKIKIPKTISFDGEILYKKIFKSNKYIIKPSKGSGSRGVKTSSSLLNFNFNDYKKNFLKRNEKIIIQDFIHGKEITVDGIIIDKKFYLLAFSEELNNKIEGHNFSTELIFSPTWIDKEIIIKIKQTAQEISNILNLENGPIHFELIIDDYKNLFLIDFSLRGGGFDVFSKIIKLTSGYDILENYLKMSLGYKIKLPKINRYKPVTLSFFYSNREGYLSSLNFDNSKINSKNYFLKILKEKNEYVTKPRAGKDRLGYYICYGDNLKSVLNLRKRVNKSINYKISDERI